jgi:3-hydroxybutyryl-CoA dehydrogenase
MEARSQPPVQPLDVVVVGAGLMGAQIGFEYALGGHAVVLHARDAARVHDRLDAARAMACEAGLGGSEETAAGHVRVTTDPGAIDRADLVVESLPEDADLKEAVLAPLAARFADAIFASNTSSLPIGDLGRRIGAPDRTLGTHYWNPPLLMPLVELVAGDETAPERVDRVERLLQSLGKRPVRVGDVPGFAWNRLQFALLREALWLVRNGVVAPEDVDEIVSEGLARRWRLIGPFATMALGGPATYERVAANLFPVLGADHSAGDLSGFARSPEDAARIKAVRDSGLAAELRRDKSA